MRTRVLFAIPMICRGSSGMLTEKRRSTAALQDASVQPALDILHTGLLKVAQDFSWQLEAWAVFSNHYHFVGRSPEDADESTSLSKMLTVLHHHTAIWVNRLDKTAGRKIWHNFWDTKLTYQ